MTGLIETSTSPHGSLSARFAPLFAEIAATAINRERARTLPTELVARLAQSGFTALRIPREFGGSAIRLSELAELLVQLAAADSNFVQILRAHFLYTDALRQAPVSPERDEWLRRIGNGEILGGAYTEQSAENRTHFSTTISPDPSGASIISGEKFYSTGSWYADWIITAGEGPDGVAQAVVARDADGVELLDDWNGFGQRLTASGTTRFHDASTAGAPQLPPGVQPGSYGTSLAQFWHIAALAGIAQVVHTETVDYVRSRKRYFAQGAGVVPALDPVVQSVVGELSSARYLAATITRSLAARLDDLDVAITTGGADEALFDEVEVEVYRAQVVVINSVLSAAARSFDVGGASAVDADRSWDRHWRNARTLASHNPSPLRLVSIGDYDINATSPFRTWLSGVDLRNRT